jgi:hypothetical protein
MPPGGPPIRYFWPAVRRRVFQLLRYFAVELREFRGAIFVTLPTRRFPPPWSVEDIGAAFVVIDGRSYCGSPKEFVEAT